MRVPHISCPIRRHGFTLAELIVSLAILVALAGVVIVSLGNKSSSGSVVASAQDTATRASAVAIRDAVMQFWSDCKYEYQGLPVASQRIEIGHLLDRSVTPGPFAAYDPNVRLGWNGPYLQADGATYVIDAGRGFPDTYGEATHLAIRNPVPNQDTDDDGRDDRASPFAIQEPTLVQLAAASQTYTVGLAREVRVVSAGPNGVLEIDESRFAAELEADPSLQGDDIYVTFTLR